MNQYVVPLEPEPRSLPAILGRTSELLGASDYDGAIALLQSEHRLVSGEPVACNTLAYLLIQVDRPAEAIAWFETSLRLRPDDIQATTGLAMAFQSTGDVAGALHCYDRLVALQPDEAATWSRRGELQAQCGQLEQALASLDRSLALQDDDATAFVTRSKVLEKLGHAAAATDAAARACMIAPGEAEVWLRLADLLQKAGNLGQSIAAYERALSLSPDDIACLENLGIALKAAARMEDALRTGRRILAIDPSNQEALLLCGNAELHLGNAEAARASFLAAAKAGVACRYPATAEPPAFRALMLFSPFAGNTPYEDLISNVRFDTDLVIVLEDHYYDCATLAANADVVVNLISDADLGLDMLGALGELVALLDKPVINHPALIVGTDRQTISRRLAAVRNAVVPATLRTGAMELLRRIDDGSNHLFPLIVRHAGTHGGEKMELVESPEDLRAFALQAGDQPLYLTAFVDYRSPDGFFRKYRLIFVGDEIFPYHLAIGESWKVHHISTRMTELEWMRNEEQAFLDAPTRVFGPSAMAALDTIRRIVALDYFGIDCSIDADGKVVVFEVNATMLVHLHNEGFEYKTPHVLRIKAAFERLLENRASSGREPRR